MEPRIKNRAIKFQKNSMFTTISLIILLFFEILFFFLLKGKTKEIVSNLTYIIRVIIISIWILKFLKLFLEMVKYLMIHEAIIIERNNEANENIKNTSD